MKLSLLRYPALVAASAHVLTGCASSKPSLNIGMRQTALDLEFKVAALAKPVAREVLVQYIPAAPAPQLPVYTGPKYVYVDEPPVAVPEPVELPDPCPEAAFDAVPKYNVALKPAHPPKAGVYNLTQSGTASVSDGASTVQANLPAQGSVSFGLPVLTSPSTLDTAANTGTPGAEFDMVTTVSPKYVVTERLRITNSQIEMLSRTIVDGTRKIEFVADPAITYYKFGLEQDSWNSASVDLDRHEAMLVQGTIGKRERIDICGELVDTYTVTITENFINLDTGEQIVTNAAEPNTFQIATQYGGLLVKRHVSLIDTFTDAKTQAALTEKIAYTSTMQKTSPSSALPK